LGWKQAVLVNGTALISRHSGTLFWPEQSLLIVADLHLEKGSSRAKKGHYLSPYDTAMAAILRRLTTVVTALDPALFHLR
jgi:metallophosphoesterase superfamily enzyme